jgi:chromate reductase
MYALNQPEVLINHASEKFDAQGRLTDAATRTRIRDMLLALVEWTHRVSIGAPALTS